MTEIVKHGNLYTTFECKFCGCIFRTASITENKDLYNHPFCSANCPECGREATTYNKGE